MSLIYERVLLWIVLASFVSMLWLLCRSIKMNIIREFENGVSAHYLRIGHELNVEEEILFFSFRHLKINQVLFLFICWIIRTGNPESTLHDLRFPAVVADNHVNDGNIIASGRIGAGNKPRINI